jgi:hypothetical protein
MTPTASNGGSPVFVRCSSAVPSFATIDPSDPDVFSFDQHLVAANLPSYVPPAP